MLLLLTSALHPPVRSALERTAKSYKRKSRRVPELRIARGSIAEGVTGSGSCVDLFGVVWALSLTQNGLKLFRFGVAGWSEVVPLDPLPLLPSGARHVALAFDQSARPVIAWEASSQIFVRQYDAMSSQYVVRGGFAGVDPVLIMDATVNGDTANSDVILGYLSTSRDALITRVQREIFATPRSVSVPNDSTLDAAFVSGLRLVFFGSSAGESWFVNSDNYPLLPVDTISTSYNLVADAIGNTVTSTLQETVTGSFVLIADAIGNTITFAPQETVTGSFFLTGNASIDILPTNLTETVTGSFVLTGNASTDILPTNLTETVTGAYSLTGSVF